MAYRKAYFRIRTYNYGHDSGWTSDADRIAFKEESRQLFQELGWIVHAGDHGACDTVAKDRQDLYLHPSSFSGVIDEANIQPLQNTLSKAQTFHCYALDCYEEYMDMSIVKVLSMDWIRTCLRGIREQTGVCRCAIVRKRPPAWSVRQMTKILFICHGNICRSPMAEFVMKDLVKKAGLEAQFHIESAATSTDAISSPVYPPARRKLAEHGINCAGKTARQLTNADYDRYDLLIGMDRANLRNMHRICGGDHDGKLHLLMEYTDHPGEVADPWYTDDFEATWRDVLEGCAGLLERLQAEGGIG